MITVECGIIKNLLQARSTLRLVFGAAFRQCVVSLDERAAQRLVGAVIWSTALALTAATADHVWIGRRRDTDVIA